MPDIDYDIKVLQAEARALGMARLTPEGREVVDSTPMSPPIGYKRTPSLMESMRAMIRSEQLAMEARASGHETFEEANDFEVGDDYDPTSPYEEFFDPPPAPDPAPAGGGVAPAAPTAEEQPAAPVQAGPAS